MSYPNTKTVAEVLAVVAGSGSSDDEVTPEDWEARRDEWLEELEQLFEQIGAWVQPAADAKHAEWKARPPVVLKEDFIGQYAAPSFELDVGRRRLVFRPVGTLLVGSRGRVDVVGGTRSAMLLLGDNPGAWSIAKRTPRMTITALDEDSFAALLSEFLTGA
jgi:hypothetical protein